MPFKKGCALQKAYSRIGEDKMRFIVLGENKLFCVRDKLKLWKPEYVIMMTHYILLNEDIYCRTRHFIGLLKVQSERQIFQNRRILPCSY